MTDIRPGVWSYSNFSENTAASHVITAGVSGAVIKLIGLVLVATNAVTATIEDEDGTDLLGPLPLGANTPLVLTPTNTGWTKTPTGKGLNILLGGAVQVGGGVIWRDEPA